MSSFKLLNVPLDCFLQPDGDYEKYRVRSTDTKQVDNLYKQFLKSAKSTLFASTFNVMCTQKTSEEITQEKLRDHDFVIIDGNHRYQALVKYREEEKVNFADYVPCFVHPYMEPSEAVGIGYNRNTQDGKSKKMSNFETVVLVKAILDRLDMHMESDKSAEDKEKKEKKSYAALYRFLQISDDVSNPLL